MREMLSIVPATIRIQELGDKLHSTLRTNVDGLHDGNRESGEELDVKVRPDAKFTTKKRRCTANHVFRGCELLGQRIWPVLGECIRGHVLD